MKTLITNFLLILNTISVLVHEAEVSTEKGEAKKKAVIDAAEKMLKEVGINIVPYETMISNLIDIAVFFYNVLHIFEHKTQKG